MKLTPKALESINNLDGRLALASAMGFSETWIRTCLKKNKSNGPLTTVSALKVIKKETGLTESEILTKEAVEQVGS